MPRPDLIRSTKEVPVSIRTDRYQIDLYPRTRVVRFSRLRIVAGEIVPTKAVFTLSKKDFQLYPKALKALLQVMASWRTTS